MLFDFDTRIDRRAGDSMKWNRYAGRDVLPMWVADMDFAAPPVVIDALHRRIDHGVLGYAEPWPALTAAVVAGVERDHGWRIAADWLVWVPGLVTGLNVACRTVGEPGDGVFTTTPIYPPFLTAPGLSGRRVETAPLLRSATRWEVDLDRIDSALNARTRLFLLCNPHNPTGRVFSPEELTAIARLAERHGLVVCADEIHCDLVLEPGCRHLPFATLDESVAARTITLMAPSKTYNIPGLGCAFAVIPDAVLRQAFRAAMRGIVPHVNVLGLVAAEAAYRDGGAWRGALLRYLRGNRDRVIAALRAMPRLSATKPEATYLAWIDARGIDFEDPVAFFEAAGVGLSDGRDFGTPGFVRLNFGCTRSVLDEGLRRMATALTGAG